MPVSLMEAALFSDKLDSSASCGAFRRSCEKIHRINYLSTASVGASTVADHKCRSGSMANGGANSPIRRHQYYSIDGALESDHDDATTCQNTNRVHANNLTDNTKKSKIPLPSPAMTIRLHRRPFVSHGEVSLQGCRRNMEDAVATVPGFWPGHGFFAVYDGHGGPEAAEVCKDRMHVVLAEEMWKRRTAAHGGRTDDDGGTGDLLRRCWMEALEATFMVVDAEVLLAGKPGSGKTVGSTAVVGVVGSRDIVVANCGDSRAVLCRGGEPVPLSFDHKPDRPDELARIEAAGGRVINWGGHRVMGVLATSRSVGDQYLKPYVTPEPEVTVTPRTDRDEFLILATDGLWDTVSNEAACAVARRCLAGLLLPRWTPLDGSASAEGNVAQVAAVVLAELAMSRGGRDNVTVVVVELRKVTAKRRRKGQVVLKRRTGDATGLKG